MTGLRIGGLNRTLKTLARPVRTPGGWGAEESGTRAGPGREATVAHVASQLGVCLAQMGPHYDSANEAVIPAVKNAAAVATESFSRLNTAAVIRRRAPGVLPPGRPLRALPGGAIMTP